ncbi:hypothetical protein KO527_22040 [Pseudoalteromonas sp. C2R02]|uniref:hypothetical protein n=1 Tax=Pseudoalteromonas sp. C2R02 TaxID=2841565 RepID=UPI001C09B125|nr:hypothetical protein [Pseudoalteromonas sp. C2R02]MBU2972022.1 hypothetical protein [Pseudoalteromonas sp. C2R02]
MRHSFILPVEKIANISEDCLHKALLKSINTIRNIYFYIKENFYLSCLLGKHVPNKDWVRDFKTSKMKCSCLKCDAIIIGNK